MFSNKIKGFTLVELIVVIVILAILGTIGFISYTGVVTTARDSIRLSDMSLMKKSLTLHYSINSKFLNPDNFASITYSGGLVWKQGTFGESVIRGLGIMSKIPTDPLTKNEYTYSVLNGGHEFEIAGVLEGDIAYKNDILSSTNAAAKRSGKAIIIGNYNGSIAKTSSGNTTYVLAVPSIISGDISLTDIEDILSQQKLVYNGYENLPASYTGTTFTIDGGFDYNPTNIVIFSGDINNLNQEFEKKEFIRKLQNSYTGSYISYLDNSFSEISSIDVDNSGDTKKIINIINIIVINIFKGNPALVDSGINSNALSKIFYNREAFALIKPDGSVVTWGSIYQNYGGDSSSVQSELTNVVSITGNRYAFAALKSDGTVVTWGQADRGGDSSSVQSELIDVKNIVGENNRGFAALKNDGTVVAWGIYGACCAPEISYTSVKSQLVDVKKLYVTDGSYVALKNDGTVVTWGSAYTGGNSALVASNLTGITDIYSTNTIVTNGSAFIAKKSDNTLVAWGNPNNGGDISAVQSELVNVKKVFVNVNSAAALKNDGTVVTWGNTNNGGDSSSVQSDLSGVINIFKSENAFAALKSDGTVVVWGNAGWGSTGYGGNVAAVQSSLTGVINIYGNGRGFVAEKDDGTFVSWGSVSNHFGWGAGDQLIDVADIQGGNGNYAALLNNGTVVGWGSYLEGGNISTVQSDLTGVTNIFSNDYSYVAFKDDGTVVTWSDQSRGGDSSSVQSELTNIYLQ